MKTNAMKPNPNSMLDVRCWMLDVSLVLLLLLASAPGTRAATRYVWQDSPSPGPPYDTWANAAHDIQTAVDAAQTGDSVLVMGGVYATGGRAVYGTMTNRVAIDRAITVESLMGPEVTILQGAQAPGGGNGDGAIRCVYLTNGASLSGFTLTSGATRTSGDWEREECGGGAWCASTNAVLTNCVLSGNSALARGGAYGGTLNHCTLTANSAMYGGGAYGATLNHCTLTANSASRGGGAYGGTLKDCTLIGNSAQGLSKSEWGTTGGGAYGATLNNCVLTGNSASCGGGADGGTLNNCTLTRNSAMYGGGAYGATLNHCTLTANSASRGGGVHRSTLNNCIVYFNTGLFGANYYQDAYGGVLSYCCTTPMPAGGTGNITLDPQLASASHLSASSPCRGAGSPAFASGTDIDGEAWAAPPSIGCDEYHPGAVTGPLGVTVGAAQTNVVPGCEVGFTALIQGQTTASVWDFGDGTVVSNRPYATHAWAAVGDYAVILRAYNQSYPAEVSATVTVHVVAQRVHYVALDSVSPLRPYTSWATAATNIQEAVDAATVAGSLVLVSNGVYATGERAVVGTTTNLVVVDKPLMLRSVNGPELTVIDGGGSVRCVYLASGASLSGFTLTNGATRATAKSRESGGGGLWCESASAVVSDCVLTGNSASKFGGGAYDGTLNHCTLSGNSASYGGGAYGGTLNNCVLSGNWADGSAVFGLGPRGGAGGGACGCILSNCTLTANWAAWWGGGADSSTLNNCTLTANSVFEQEPAWLYLHSGGGAANSFLYNCTLTGNSARHGGGAADSTLYNCTLTGNSGLYSVDNYDASSLNYCCTTPMPTNGIGNIAADPRFVNPAGGDLRLRPDSPCIDAGTNLTGLISTDILGLPRPMDGNNDGLSRFDIGAYEFNPYRFEPTLHLTGDGFWFSVRGEPARSVRIERSRDLLNWEYAGEVPIPACGQTLIDPVATSESRLFYRAMRVP